MAVMGNQGTIRMIYQGFQRLGSPTGDISNAGLPRLWVWGVRGFARVLGGEQLPFAVGDWYWIPSRAIPAPGEVEPITEFPFFTVLYGDLHAHLVALPLTLLALGLIIGLVLGRGRWQSLAGGLAWFGLAGLAIGVLRPTNTWDMPTYLALGMVALLYTGLRYIRIPDLLVNRWPALYQIPAGLQRLAVAAAGAILLAGLAFLFFQPYAEWYALGYTKIDFWKGLTTPAYSYLIHWGLFLFSLVSWMAWETIDWMASTPASALRKLSPYWTLIKILSTGFLTTVIALVIWADLYIAWIVLPLGLWTVILLLRPNQPDAKRIVLFLFGTGLVLTLMVELVVLVGDVGRMNTVFKFYLQVWTLFAIGAAAGLGWVLPWVRRWKPEWQLVWQTGLTVLVFGALLYTFMATMAKIEDRMALEAPHTLDGMAYMPHATYVDEWGPMPLDQDYEAIRWLQENVQGSPVIVEANLRNLYRWGSRMTIYTGLPGVVGWEWHQQQQRAVIPGLWVTQRIMEIDNFYLTEDLGAAQEFLHKYNVRYIIVGLQERGHYPGPGLEKFEAADGALWRSVYRDRDTVIYEVMDQLGLKP
jgi:YYY domain-containing protein